MPPACQLACWLLCQSTVAYVPDELLPCCVFLQLDAMHKVDARVVSASDYSILITGINPGKTSDK